MRLLRNLSRRKLRTGLTIAGITIGIWALVVFSAMANKIDALADGGSRYYADKVLVSDGTVSSFDLPMRLDAGDQIAALDGADVVVPSVTLLADTIQSGISMGGSTPILGSPAEPLHQQWQHLTVFALQETIGVWCQLRGLGVDFHGARTCFSCLALILR